MLFCITKKSDNSIIYSTNDCNDAHFCLEACAIDYCQSIGFFTSEVRKNFLSKPLANEKSLCYAISNKLDSISCYKTKFGYLYNNHIYIETFYITRIKKCIFLNIKPQKMNRRTKFRHRQEFEFVLQELKNFDFSKYLDPKNEN